jgi:hypothetical protein
MRFVEPRIKVILNLEALNATNIKQDIRSQYSARTM